MPSYLDRLECTQCAKTYPSSRLSKTSPCCDKVLFARYDLLRMRREVDREALNHRPDGMWRFAELLPVEDPNRVITLGEGGSPLLKAGARGQGGD